MSCFMPRARGSGRGVLPQGCTRGGRTRLRGVFGFKRVMGAEGRNRGCSVKDVVSVSESSV